MVNNYKTIKLLDDEAYRFWKLYSDTVIIQYGEGLYAFLLLGEKKALLIDTTFGRGEFPNIIQFLKGDLKLCVVNTHGHYDHTGGNPWFPKIYMHQNAMSYAKHSFGSVDKKWFDNMPYPDYEMIPVDDGYVFDLGERSVEVLYTPAHSDSSLSFIDHKRRILFSGDEFDSGQANLGNLESVKSFLANMQRLKSREAEFDFICPSHNGCPISKEYIDDFVLAAQHILNGSPDTVSFDGLPGYKQPHSEGSTRVQVGLSCINFRNV